MTRTQGILHFCAFICVSMFTFAFTMWLTYWVLKPLVESKITCTFH